MKCLAGVSLLMLLVAGGFATFIRAADEPMKTIFGDDATHELQGNTGYENAFTGEANTGEWSLLFDQKFEQPSSGRYWQVSLNGKLLGRLEAHRSQLETEEAYDGFHHIGLAIPVGAVREGENKLTVSGSDRLLVLRNLRLVNRPLAETMRMGTIEVKVVTEGKEPVPARITVVDQRGQLVKLYDVRTDKNAVRPGILYTLGAGDSFGLPAGKYTLYATRGMEWGFARQTIEIRENKKQSLTLQINREVDTPGFLACDSHIHTLPGSGHGNATYQERMITIAGEGIEVAVATDHNHISDYEPHQHATGTHKHFHAIPGDEVTTHNGHFTAFPLDSSRAVPGGVQGRNPLFLKVEDWTELLADMRSKGAEVVVLNHPYWPTIPEGPFGRFHFDRETAERMAGPEFTFDGIEVAQPANKTPDSFYALEDWLALLNRGTRLTAVGATDSHTVNDPVGQARTYLESRTDDVAKIDRADVYRAFVEGRASVAAGIFATLKIEEKYSMGDMVSVSKLDKSNTSKEDPQTIVFQLRVAAPSWIRPRQAMIYINGERVWEQAIETTADQPTDETLNIAIPVPKVDAHVVAFVLGDSITLPGWTTLDKPTQAITNPIYLDVDNDRGYRSPRETAQQLIAEKLGESKTLSAAQRGELLNAVMELKDPAILTHVKDLIMQME